MKIKNAKTVLVNAFCETNIKKEEYTRTVHYCNANITFKIYIRSKNQTLSCVFYPLIAIHANE